MSHPPPTSSLGRVFTLSTKLITLMSLVIILGSICLGLYFLEMQVRYQTKALMNTGKLLTENLAHDGRYNLFIKDSVGLHQLIAGTLAVEEVVYVMVSDNSGQVLVQQSKGTLNNPRTLDRSAATPLYAPPSIRQRVLSGSSPELTITSFPVSHDGEEVVPANHGKARTVLTTFFWEQSEILYDFAVPILRSAHPLMLDPSLSFELQSESDAFSIPGSRSSPIYGVIQIGLSDAYLQRELQTLVQKGILITCLIVIVGVVFTVFVARRMTVPLKALTHQAGMIPKGHLSYLPPTDSEDEIGQLTTSFNHMVDALRQEKHAVERQISWLTTIDTVGTSISSSLSLDDLLSTAIQQLVEHSDFHHAVIGLYDDQRRILSSLHGSGLPSSVIARISDREFPIEDSGGLLARVLLHHQSFVAHDLELWSKPSDTPIVEWLERQNIASFLIVPLESHHHILGFLAVAKGAIRCEEGDLSRLNPIATKLGIAIDRVHANLELQGLMRTLELRVQERTEELQWANAKLKNLDRLKSMFVSIASHELRTPLTSIKVFVENLFRGVYGPMTQDQTQHLNRVRINVDRLRRMISELLDLTQIETGRMKLSFTSVSLVDLVQEAIDSLSPLAQDKAISLRCLSPPEVPCLVGDRDKLFQILTNLIHNAVKFTPKAGEIIIRIVCRDDDQLEVCVADSGCGISPEELRNVFLPFYRTGSNTSEDRGAGLGLALTRHLVELHKGHLWAESTLNKGSRFSFTLPVESQPKPALA